MQKRLTEALLAAIVLAVPAAGCGDSGTEPRPDAELSILFIGNSLTMSNELPDMVAALLDSAGAGPTEVWDESVPGTALVDHWDRGFAVDALNGGDWDYVVMQQGPSATEGRPYLYSSAPVWGEAIRAAGAIPVMYMVWPAESRSFDFDGVSESYATAARLAGGIVAPAGDAWRAAWERNAQLDFYSSDRFHPSLLGSYVAALTIAATVSRLDPERFPSRFETSAGWVVDIDSADAAVVRDAVREVVAN